MSMKITRAAYADMFGPTTGDRLWVGACVLLALVTFDSSPSSPAEGQWRWRLSENADRISLYIADTDGPTDNVDSPRFQCHRASGQIQVDVLMDAEDAEAIAKIIREKEYPRIQWAPYGQADWSILQPSFTEMDGWQYTFEMNVSAQVFDVFRKTGIFEFRIGSALIRKKLAAGMENVAKFQNACRSPRTR
jgi:hypothetical protein